VSAPDRPREGRTYTRESMDTARSSSEGRDGRFDGLHAEAKEALGYSANTLRAIRDRYREAYREELARWHRVRDDIEAMERVASTTVGDPRPAPGDTGGSDSEAAVAAEAGAEDARERMLRADDESLAAEVGLHQAELGKLDLAQRNLESTWLFLERGDASLITDRSEIEASPPTDVQMRIVEAQEAERSRLAQEVHDGPAQALSNAIFQVEYIERVLDQDIRLARTELRFLRDLLRRELGDVRGFIAQLRPPLLDQLGLEGAIADIVATMSALTGLPIEMSMDASPDRIEDAAQTVVLRVVQEALQNVRKHATASRVTVASRMSTDEWILEIRDDGRGFDVGTVAVRGRRNFGLQFMRERAELIGARFEVRSRPAGGTVVMLAIPTGEIRR
jgi:two-component system, NarL family, sensor histidine kinase DegS